MSTIRVCSMDYGSLQKLTEKLPVMREVERRGQDTQDKNALPRQGLVVPEVCAREAEHCADC